MSGLRAVLVRPVRDAECVTHGVVPKVHDGCMKCGAGTVVVSSRRAASEGENTATWSTAGGARSIDVGTTESAAEDDDGWDAGW